MRYTPLLKSDTPSICEELAIKEKIIIRKNNYKYNKNTHLEGYTRQSYLVLTHLSQRLTLSIFTAAPLQYFPGHFPLTFLEGCCPSLSPTAISLHLDLTTWDPSVPSNRAAFSSSTSSQSCWMYSNILFFFFFSSTTLCFLASPLVFFFASFLVF